MDDMLGSLSDSDDGSDAPSMNELRPRSGRRLNSSNNHIDNNNNDPTQYQTRYRLCPPLRVLSSAHVPDLDQGEVYLLPAHTLSLRVLVERPGSVTALKAAIPTCFTAHDLLRALGLPAGPTRSAQLRVVGPGGSGNGGGSGGRLAYCVRLMLQNGEQVPLNGSNALGIVVELSSYRVLQLLVTFRGGPSAGMRGGLF